jgi:transcriptional regulator of arginine metabolism
VKTLLISLTLPMHIYTLKSVFLCISMFQRPSTKSVKTLRHNAIRQLVSRITVTSQDDLRQRLASEGFDVTQATLSRDLNELGLIKSRNGYALPAEENTDEDLPTLYELLASFGLGTQQAMNQIVIRTTLGSAQPVAAAIDQEDWDGVLGTIAGDDTILVICPDTERATQVRERLEGILQS